MKKILQVFCFSLLLLLVSSDIVNAQSNSGPSPKKFMGTWTLNSVTLSNLVDTDVVKLFDLVAPKEFNNATLMLDKNDEGSFTLANGSVQYINWSVNGGDALGPMFQFKKVNKGQSPDEVPMGYQLVISSIKSDSMVLKFLVFSGKRNGYVVMNFTKPKP